MNDAQSNIPVVTVLMSVYNGARWLEEAITSILTQTFKDFEFIIVNDGSTDKTLEIIKNFQELDPRIVLINKSNTGLADSLNCGICNAKGEWIARLDADDLCEPDRLKKQYQLAQSCKDFVLIGSCMRFIDEQGVIGVIDCPPITHKGLMKNLMVLERFFAHSSAFYRTETVRTIGGYRARIKRAQDYDLWLRLSEVGAFAVVDELLIRHRKHDGQISNEEKGRRQKIDARVALTSYWLRQIKCPDPVAGCEEDFEIFWSWITERLSQERLFDYYSFLDKLHQYAMNSQDSMKQNFRAVAYIFQQPRFIVRYMKNRLYGETLSRRLAFEWAKKMINTPWRPV